MKCAFRLFKTCVFFTTMFAVSLALATIDESLVQRYKALGLDFSTGTTMLLPSLVLEKLDQGFVSKVPPFQKERTQVSIFNFDPGHRKCSVEAASDGQIVSESLPGGRWIFHRLLRLESAPNIFERAQGEVATFYQSEWLSMDDARSKVLLTCLFTQGAEVVDKIEKDSLSIINYPYDPKIQTLGD
jgi:hypothetical protein